MEMQGHKMLAWPLLTEICTQLGLDTLVGPSAWEAGPDFQIWVPGFEADSGLLEDELMQLGRGCHVPDWHTLLKPTWDKLDALILGMYYAAVGVRITAVGDAATAAVARLLFVLAFTVLLMRWLRLYTGARSLGPKVEMLGLMLSDIMVFLMLMAVFLVSWGVAEMALLHPTETLDGGVASGIFYHSYFQIFGETFLDGILEESECIGVAPFTSCGTSQQAWLPAMLAVYLIVTNVVLVNLLIAMMSRTYNRVEEQAMQRWRLQDCHLLAEYKEKSSMPTPLLVLHGIIPAVRAIRSWFARIPSSPPCPAPSDGPVPQLWQEEERGG